MKQLEAHEVQLAKVFGNDYAFRIPNYQRPYAWEVEQAEQLLADLVDFMDDKGDEPYFLGSIVLIKKPGSPEADVVDGQQRLTTLTILLAVVRDLTANNDLRQAVHTLITRPGDIVMGLEGEPRLELRSKDAEFFATRIQALGCIPGLLALDGASLKTDAQRAILANATALHASLSAWSEDRLLELVQLLGQRTFMVMVSTPDLDSAHRIFSVMNARGLDLSPSDIFKSYIVGDLSGDEHAADLCAAWWEDAEDALGRDAFADLFLHIRMIFAKEKAKRELLKEFPEQVLKPRYLPGNAKAFVTNVLIPYADAYEQISGKSYSSTHGAEKVNAWFRRLAQLDNQDWRPAALWALRHHGQDPVFLDEFLRALERLAVSLYLRRVYTTPRVQRYAELLRQLDNDHAGLTATAFELSAQEQAETSATLDGPIYQSTKTRKYVLLRLNELLAPGSGITLDFPLITVEHVLPQNPKPGSQWMADFTSAQRSLWTHRLANLVLLNRAKNAEAQNYDFTTKKAKYFASKNGVAPFPITVQVVNQPEWTPAVLDARQNDLVSRLRTEWRLQPH